MDNFLFMPYSKTMEEFSQKLGFSKTLFLNKDFVLIESTQPQEILRLAQQAKQKKLLVLFQPKNEALLRFALEKTSVDVVYGIELLHPADSVHYVRGGLDQILCAIAQRRDKIIGFSFRQLLCAVNQPQMMARMMFNLELCRKYKVKTIFSTFAQEKMEMRSAHDLLALWRVLGGHMP